MEDSPDPFAPANALLDVRRKIESEYSNNMSKPITLGVIVGNRGFFPGHLCETGRKQVLATLEKLGLGTVILDASATKFGAVESMTDAQKCADLFQANASKLDGLLVTLPNFGDERGVANAIRWSGLKVPVLVHA